MENYKAQETASKLNSARQICCFLAEKIKEGFSLYFSRLTSNLKDFQDPEQGFHFSFFLSPFHIFQTVWEPCSDVLQRDAKSFSVILRALTHELHMRL